MCGKSPGFFYAFVFAVVEVEIVIDAELSMRDFFEDFFF